MRYLQPQHCQGNQHPVREHQILAAPGALGAQPVTAAALARRGLPAGQPQRRQFGHHLAQMVTGDPGEGRMAQGRTSP